MGESSLLPLATAQPRQYPLVDDTMHGHATMFGVEDGPAGTVAAAGLRLSMAEQLNAAAMSGENDSRLLNRVVEEKIPEELPDEVPEHLAYDNPELTRDVIAKWLVERGPSDLEDSLTQD